jgi:hypothetical protein
MLSVKFKSLFLCAAFTVGFCMAVAGSAGANVVTISFQNGVNGYNGAFDRTISEREEHNVDGSGVINDFLDGYQKDTSPDEQRLLRFDNIIGSEPRQIPAGATILSAELTVTTAFVSNAQTGGPYGVAGVLQAFDSATMYYDFISETEMVSRGPWWQDGSATRPTGGFGRQHPGSIDSGNVTSLVQIWADGADNLGFAIQAGLPELVTERANTTDGWSFATTGNPGATKRPKLTVSYTTDPVVKSRFQEGTDGYAGTTMAIVRSGMNAIIEDAGDPDLPEQTEDGSTLDQTFLDGLQFADIFGSTSSPDDLALLKFANVFGTESGQIPMNVPVAKAWVVITTGDTNTNANTTGPYAAYAMLRPWDTTSLHSSFGTVNGLQISDGDIGPVLDSLDGFTRGAEVWFDVTDYLEGVRTGATGHGIAIQANGTNDGWQIHTNGSTTPDARPRLVVISADLSAE